MLQKGDCQSDVRKWVEYVMIFVAVEYELPEWCSSLETRLLATAVVECIEWHILLSESRKVNNTTQGISKASSGTLCTSLIISLRSD